MSREVMRRLDRIEAAIEARLGISSTRITLNLVAVGDPIPEGTLVLTPHGSLAFQMPEMPTADGLPGPLPQPEAPDPSPSTPEPAAPAQGPFPVGRTPLPTKRHREEPDVNSGLW